MLNLLIILILTNFIFIYFINSNSIFKFTKRTYHYLLDNIYLSIEKNKINNVLIKFIEFNISLLNSGVHPYQSFKLTLERTHWPKSISIHFYNILNLVEKGRSFNESIEHISLKLRKNSELKYIFFYLNALRLSLNSGSRTAIILTKVKEQILNNVTFKKKMKSATAQMRMQSNVIISAPIIIGIILYFIDKKYLIVFFKNSFCFFIFCTMILIYLLGIIILRKILKVFEN